MKEKIVTHASHAKLQYYRHNYCLVTMTGVLGCRWHRYQQSTRENRKRDYGNFLVVLLAFLYIVLFFIFWLVASNDRYFIAVDMFHRVGTYIPWYGLGLALSSATFAYLAVILILCTLHVIHGHQLYIHLSHVMLAFIITAACILFSIIIDIEWPILWPLFYISLKVFGPFILLTTVIVLTVLSWLLIRQWFRLMSKTSKAVCVGVFVCLMLFLYLCPLFIDTPIFRDDTPDKPDVVAFGGASHISPENTMFAFKKAVSLGATSIFTTVQLSYDGFPFLMSDTSLLRTTNAKDVLPNRTSDDPSQLNKSDILSLSAGEWFLNDDPWDTSGDLSSQEHVELQTEKVPLLSTLLQFVSEQSHNKVKVYLRLRRLPSWHPYREGAGFQKVLDTLNKETRLKHSNVYIPPDVYRLDPSYGLLAGSSSSVWHDIEKGLTPNTNSSAVYMPVRTDMASVIRRFRHRNISSLVLEVNSAWFLSYAWCADASMVATRYVQSMRDVGSPIIHMNEDGYLALWVTTDILSVAAILIMFVVQRIRLYGTNFSPEAISLSTGRVRTSHRSRTMKEKLLRDGAVMDTMDDMENSGAGGPGEMDVSEGGNSTTAGEVSMSDILPAFSNASALQPYPVTTAMASLSAGQGSRDQSGSQAKHDSSHYKKQSKQKQTQQSNHSSSNPLYLHHHRMSGSVSDGEVGLSPPVASLDRYSL